MTITLNQCQSLKLAWSLGLSPELPGESHCLSLTWASSSQNQTIFLAYFMM